MINKNIMLIEKWLKQWKKIICMCKGSMGKIIPMIDFPLIMNYTDTEYS